MNEARRPAAPLSRTLMKAAGHTAATLAVTLLISAWRLGVLDRRFIYTPSRVMCATPSEFGLSYEEVHFRSRDGTDLHGWFVPGRRRVTLLWCHGRGGNISHGLDRIKALHDEVDCSIFLFDYRGYGRSRGRPSEAGTYLDAEAALAYLRSRDDLRSMPIIYFGYSLGTAVATELAIRQPPTGLVLETPLPSIPHLVRGRYPWLPASLLLRTRYDSLAKAARITSPVLVLHGDLDEMIPIGAGRLVFDAVPEPKAFHVVPGAGHCDTFLVGGNAYFAALLAFIEQVTRGVDGARGAAEPVPPAAPIPEAAKSRRRLPWLQLTWRHSRHAQSPSSRPI